MPLCFTDLIVSYNFKKQKKLIISIFNIKIIINFGIKLNDEKCDKIKQKNQDIKNIRSKCSISIKKFNGRH